MSSRILRGDVAKLTAPVVWRDTGKADAVRLAKEAGRSPQAEPASGKRGRNEQQIEEAAQEAYEKGFWEGQAALRQKHEAEVQPLLERLSEIAASFAGLRDRVRRESEDDLIEISLAIARRILHREVTLDPEAMRGLVKAALQKIGNRELNRVRVHPDHKALLRTVIDQACPNKGVELIADPALRPGDILFETDRGELDGSIDSQLDEIGRGLTDRLEG